MNTFSNEYSAKWVCPCTAANSDPCSTCLKVLTDTGEPECQVEELMDMGAELTAKDKRGISALHYACGQGRLEIVKYLWSKGVDLDSDDPGAHLKCFICSVVMCSPPQFV